jgi:hypothetical protein
MMLDDNYFRYMCVCVLVHPFLTKYNQISCTYVFHVVLRLCLLFYNFLLAIVLSVLRYTDSDFPFGICNLFLVKSRDLNIELLTISSANIWKLSGLELKDILIQQELISIENDRTNILEKTITFILKEFKFGH